MKRLLLLALLLSGCARLVVLDPDDVARLNDQRWTLYSEPRVQVVTAPPPDAAPPP